jgi:hypothetical protein
MAAFEHNRKYGYEAIQVTTLQLSTRRRETSIEKDDWHT